MAMAGALSIGRKGLQTEPGRGRRASWSSCIASLSVGAVLAAGACAPAGASLECEVPEPQCSTMAAEIAGSAARSRPGVAIQRIRILAHGGYEVHYADGTIEAAVP